MQTVLFTMERQSFTIMDLSLTLAILLAVFLLGRYTRRGHGLSAPGGPPQASSSQQAFMKGLNYLMSDHPDQAIDEFSRSVALNSDTVETYMVLGNLFRQKGEVERAVRIRQSIIARPNLNPALRLQALYDLGLDYRKGGLFNRAMDTFQEILTLDPKHVEASRQMVYLYEEVREWDKAFAARKRADKLTGQHTDPVLAHYKTELGKELMQAKQLDQAEEAFDQAISVHKNCLDAYLHLGDLHLQRGRPRKALSLWRKALKVSPDNAQLAISRVAKNKETLGQEAVDAFYGDVDLAESGVAALLTIAQSYYSQGKSQAALDLVNLAVQRTPSRLDAQRLKGEILLGGGESGPALTAYQELLQHIPTDGSNYQCGQCGFISHYLTWKCPSCQQWDTITTTRGAP